MSNKFGDLSHRFQKRCEDDLEMLKIALIDTSMRSSDDFQRRLHQLAGASGFFGQAELGERALALEGRLVAGLEINDLHLQDLIDRLALVV